MADQKRLVRMLDEILKVPGNNNCADCKSPAPRWASVNLGIFICVSCATIHRGLGTHHSRVKSVTLDSWTREQVMSLKSIGNTASNAIYNPDERRNPPPTHSGSSERDSEMEKYIRKKYELGAFKAGASTKVEPTSMNRYRHYNQSDRPGVAAGGRNGNGDGVAEPWARDRENRRNPELNDLVIKLEKQKGEERDLPPLPISASSTGPSSTAGRERPKPTSSPAPPSSTQGSGIPPQRTPSQQQQQQLVDLGGVSSNSTLPLQQHLSPMSYPTPIGSPGNTLQGQGYSGYMSSPVPAFSPNQPQAQGSYFQSNQPQSQTQSQPSFNPFLQQQQQQQNGFFQQQQSPQYQGQMISPNTMHHTNPFFSQSGANPNSTQGYSAQMAVQQAMSGPQQSIFPAQQMGMGMQQGGGGGQGGWQYNPQQPYQPPQQNMAWGNGPAMGYTYAQGQ